jgi:glutamine synthetase
LLAADGCIDYRIEHGLTPPFLRMTQAELAIFQQTLVERGVRYCLGAYVDIHGVPKGKFVPVSHFQHFAGGSELYTGYALDGLGQAPNDDEIASLPDLERCVQVPWRKELAWFPADNTLHGEPYPLSTRVLLKRVLAEADQLGFGFNLGIECEVYFLKQDERGRLLVPNGDDNLEKSCYDVKRLTDSFPLIDELVSSMNGLGWDVYSFDHEDGNSQFEFDFAYSDGLSMADRYIFFRYMAKELAKKHGLLAVFMPKPFADKTGNGAHFNMSLCDRVTRENLFAQPIAADPKGLGLTPLAYSFIAGVVRRGRAICAALAPTVNSYKRLVRRGAMSYYSWAPVFSSFGSNNRTNSIRVPMGGGRCECRNTDSSCNPYLAAALLLAAGLEGVREQLDPGAPHEENLYELNPAQLLAAGVAELPRTLGEAVDVFERDTFVEKVLGPELQQEFVRYKRAEWEQYHQSVSDWEIARYARLF